MFHALWISSLEFESARMFLVVSIEDECPKEEILLRPIKLVGETRALRVCFWV